MFIYLMKRSNVLKHALHSNECAGLVNDKLRVVGGGGGGGWGMEGSGSDFFKTSSQHLCGVNANNPHKNWSLYQRSVNRFARKTSQVRRIYITIQSF